MYVQTAITVFNKRLGADRREVYFPTCIRSASFLENRSSGHSTDGAHSQSLAYKLRIPLPVDHTGYPLTIHTRQTPFPDLP